MTFGVHLSLDPFTFGWIGWYPGLDFQISSPELTDDNKCSSVITLELNAIIDLLWTIPWLHFPSSLLILLVLSSSSPSLSTLLACFLDISGAREQGPRRSWEGRILTGHSACPHTSSHQSDWSGWWYRPRGSPALPHFLAQSRTAPYSSAVLGLWKHRWGIKIWKDGKGKLKLQ